jgi:7-carboxy-7-deazaguanine synthase
VTRKPEDRPPDGSEPFLRVTEIFHSIQGESTRAGLPCTFVRLTGCPLRCVWCDTAYAFHGGERMTLEAILARVGEIGTPLVEITGGEPLVHPNAFVLAERLLEEGYTVLVETSGAVDVAPLDPRIHKIMDLKCPGSGEESRNLWSNLDHLTHRDEVKFVVTDREDWEWTARTIQERGLDRRVREGALSALLVSPVWGEVDLEELAGWILASGLPVRFQMQLHKLVWGAETRGV